MQFQGKSAKAYATQIESSDHWVIKLAEAAMGDLEYINMSHHIENGISTNNLPKDSELKMAEGILSDLSIITLKMDKLSYLKTTRR